MTSTVAGPGVRAAYILGEVDMGDPDLIEFFGRPTIDVVYHELMHHALYAHCGIEPESEYEDIATIREEALEDGLWEPEDLIIEEDKTSSLSCSKCKSEEIEMSNTSNCWQFVCTVCGHSWAEEAN